MPAFWSHCREQVGPEGSRRCPPITNPKNRGPAFPESPGRPCAASSSTTATGSAPSSGSGPAKAASISSKVARGHTGRSPSPARNSSPARGPGTVPVPCRPWRDARRFGRVGIRHGYCPRMQPLGAQQVVVMGVSGVGKSTVAKGLSTVLGWTYAEGDAFHSEANVAKMAAGHPLTDEDRWPWLRSHGGLDVRPDRGGGAVGGHLLGAPARLPRPPARGASRGALLPPRGRRDARRRPDEPPPGPLHADLAPAQPVRHPRAARTGRARRRGHDRRHARPRSSTAPSPPCTCHPPTKENARDPSRSRR